MAEVIVDRYVIETQEAQKNLQAVNNSLTEISNKSKKTSAQMNTDFTNAARGGAALTKQYNGLNLAVSQFARELPNAAQSAQIFFMSIGNNFGQLQDALSRINAQNKELAAQGQKTIPVFKQMASAIFSLNSAINIGVLLLVLYGKELTNLVVSLFKGSKAFDEAKEKFRLLNQAFDSKELISAIKNVRELEANVRLARQGFIDKKDVIEQYNKTLGQTTGLAVTFADVEKGIADNARDYVRMTFFKAAANLALEESITKALEAEKLRRSTELGAAGIVGGILNPLDPTAAAQAQAAANQKALVAAESQSKGLLDIYNDFLKKAAEISKGAGIDFFGDAGADAAEEQKRLRDLRARLEREQKILQDIADQQIAGGGANVRDRENEAYQERIKLRLKLLEERIETEKKLEAQKEKDLLELQKAAFEEANEFAKANAEAEFARNRRRVEQEREVQKTLQDLAVTTAQNIFNLQSAIEQSATDQRIRNLEEEKEKELEVEGLTAAQREQIQKDFDEKRSAILNKNAEVQRKLDLAQILVTTALAVIRQFATGDPLSAPIRAALAATEGAIQYAFASAQPLPKFAKGTERVIGGERGKDSVHALLMPDEAVITANENMRHPGLAKAWNSGKLEQFLAMKYIEPMLNEVYSKDAAKINNQFINNNKISGINDKRIVKNLQENTAVNRLMLKEMRGRVTNRGNRNLWN